MYRKQYGKMTPSAWLGAELEQSGTAWMLLGGSLCAAAYVTVRFLSGSPYQMMLELGISDLIPPVWLMTLLRFFAFLTAGCAAGLVLGWRDPCRAAEKYKGCLLFVLMTVLELCWYPTLFVSGLTFVAMLESFVILGFAVGATFSFFRVSRFSGIVLLLHDVWLVYLLFLSVSVFFRN